MYFEKIETSTTRKATVLGKIIQKNLMFVKQVKMTVNLEYYLRLCKKRLLIG